MIVENLHKPIIQRDQFELVQQLISSHKRIRSQCGDVILT
ncbi:hypothetical protein [Paenibacillus sp. An7]